MQATLSFTFQSLEELHDFTAKMAVPVPAIALVPPSAAASAPEEKAPVKPRKTKTAGPDAPAPEVAEAAPAAPVDVSCDPVGIDQVRAALVAVNEKFGLVPARKVLKQFNAARATDLKPEQYADFVKACGQVK